MKEKTLSPGDYVRLTTKEREWTGWILESYDPEVILLKLESGYNIGVKESEILNVKVLKKFKEEKKEGIKLKRDESLPNVAMIITGGTISSRLDPKTGGVIPTDAEEILKIAPKISEICNIVKIEKPFMKFSENMDFKDWKILAETCANLLNDEKIKGVIITHGTDFLHYSASALAFALGKLNKPIAFSYSQRSIDRGSTDAALNLLCAAKYAVSDIAEVAIIGHKDLNDKICLAMPATKTRKMHTSRRDAFKVINDTAIAEISESDFKILKEFNAVNSENVKVDAKFNEKIALIKIHPGQDPKILEFYAQQGYKGIVLELSGLGHVPGKGAKKNWLLIIKRLVKKGVVICGAAQTLYGKLDPMVYENGRELEKTGLIFLKDMLPETAFVKLSWVLGHKNWNVKEKMLENCAGELNSRLGFEF